MDGYYRGKKILIIGGTGTIGKSLLQTMLLDRPDVIRILSRDEYKQFKLQQQYSEYTNIRYLIGDVRDAERVQRAMQDIDYVFHAAAMKHVPSCEYNPFEAVQTNIIGTQNVIQASLAAGVKKVIFTSTDKAIAPTNTYGASKLMAERLVASAQYSRGSRGTIFAAVRFGNVMGSRGSVIPLFKSQIESRRAITITDPNMSRFMMTLKQATELTLKAMSFAQGGEIFVLKMPVVRLSDLANVVIAKMANKLGLCGEEEIKVESIGLRPGEKMYEELMTVEESKIAIELPDMYIIRNVYFDYVAAYEGGVPAPIQEYSSHKVERVSLEELSDMIKSTGVFE
ncbi:UDP-N-acetylglucosamine 4,6-dehydratase family protein [Paenibacillus radicis (ex Xue et al. 2023)]|uniref:Polysaccharide biosynthesis protein n=1 Tax=Paenibacillus radicis (ex Xue et al. 2023) TaxID=2972489 RepID=A0ABT1YJD7_9BACL|nr:UDP-N-acetylglucosamine 4,6-dehydratase family protein [Paenibacillus radicis (ex Xue et al. 2023)]MCR8632383.1 polysaccharide biosynthesis protein [Paenibacillus radicis (ex Xue et al. 2023)]